MHLRREGFYPLLCLFLFLSRNWTEASVVDECSSADSTATPSFDDSSKSKGPNEGQQLPTTADVSSKDNTKHIETKTKIAPSNNSVRKIPKLNRSEKAEETVESAYFPGAEIPADVEKALASIFSQKDPQWVDCPNCKDDQGNPVPRHKIPDDMKQAIGDFAKKFHESREEGPLIDESQVPKERATATVIQEHLTSPSPKEEKPPNVKPTNPKQSSNCKLKQQEEEEVAEKEEELMKTPQLPSISESNSSFSSFLGVCFQKKLLLLLLFTLLILVSTISAVLFVYGPSDVLQWIVAVIYSALKLIPEHRKWDQKPQEETGENEDLEHERSQPQRLSSRNGRMKTKDSNGRIPTSKKKTRPQIHQKTNLEITGPSSSKKEKRKPKSTAVIVVKKGASKSKQKAEQSDQEHDDNNTWQEVTAKGRSGRTKSSTSSREDQDIFPCGNRTVSPAPPSAPTKAPPNSNEVLPPSTPDNPQTPSESFAESPHYQAEDRVQKEKNPDPPKTSPEKTKTKEETGPTEENKGGKGPTEDPSKDALELTMNTSGAFSDSPVLDVTTSDPPGTFSMTRVHQIKTEVYNERKSVSPFPQQPSPHQPSPFAVPLDLPFSAVNGPFSPVAGGSPLMTPTLPPVMQRSNPTSPQQYFNEANTTQSRISCLLQNLKNKPFSQNTVSQCHSPMGIKRLQSEDLNSRSPPARIHSGTYGVLDASRSASLSGNLNNRVNSSCQFPGLVNEGFLPHQSVQMCPEFHLGRQFSGGAPSRCLPAVSRLNQRTGSLPLTGPRALTSPQKPQAVAYLTQHPLTNDCSLFSSNPSIWSVDLAVDKEFVNSSITGARFNASSADGGGAGGTTNQELQQNVDFRMCLPDHLLSDTNATG